ncbi:hypothetical protein DEFDS_0689 [Deferribacter desulfuricans SSM1]|uniref:diguanylate cyclase n=1 Tax=Deferribacter desulfuricans (strain DSM 14783 / JCM 11476 / NBRC 101012 / SSM1) TaxID=639282 RepID=D3PC46_DEFDS|nr:GGDEF domain-containing protein [Deferribacter desulfuricans]BAI80169.1 hypothetical protein DEFDS_0689 [Deferribacter desulfuricans SSM1]
MYESLKRNIFVILTSILLIYETYNKTNENLLLLTSLLLTCYIAATLIKKVELDEVLFALFVILIGYLSIANREFIYFQILAITFLVFDSKFYVIKVILAILLILFDLFYLNISILSTFSLMILYSLFFSIFIKLLIDRLEEEIDELSITDDLTGLLNQKGFLKKFEEEYYRSVRYKKNFTVIMLDSDDLKKVNDTYGHKYGTKVILFIADEIKKNIRRTDFACRYGGDEFMICLVETPINNGKIFAERLKNNIAMKPVFTDKGRGFNVTVSVGVVGYPHTSEKSFELLDLVDKALYEAKNKGKNRVEILTKNSSL